MTSSTRRHRPGRKHKQEAVSFWKDPAGVSPVAFFLSGMVMVAGLLLGGGGGWIGDTIVQLLALPLIVVSGIEWSRNRLEATDWALLALIGGVALIACIQLMPLPMSVWAALPARTELLASLHAAGAPPPAWYSVSLNPYLTERSLQCTLPAIAMLLGVRWMSDRQRQALLLTVFSTMLFLLIIGIAHKAAPQSDALATANEAIAQANLALNSAIAPNSTHIQAQQSDFGLFSNRNHFATLLAMSVPLVVAVGLLAWNKRASGKDGAWVPLAGVMGLLLFGLLVGMIQTRSRAALVLAPIALIGSLTLLRRLGLKRQAIWAIAAFSMVIVVVAIQVAGSATISRFDNSVTTDMRWQFHATTLDAAKHFGPLGSGLGTFVQAYQQVPPVEGVLPAYVNHAHSDYHELWLETGIPGMALVACFIGWFGWASWRAWRLASRSVSATMVSRAAAISIALVLLHSYLDYPLRKTAVLVFFGMACALLAPAREIIEKRSSEHARHRRVTVKSAIIPSSS